LSDGTVLRSELFRNPRQRVSGAKPSTLGGRRGAALMNVGGMGANMVIVAAQAIVLIPMYLANLGPRLYGAWLGSGDVLMVLQLFDLGLPNVITQRVGAAHARSDRAAIGVYFGSGAMAMLMIATAVSGGALLLSFVIADWMHLQGEEARTLVSSFRFAAIATFLFVANLSVHALSRGLQDATVMNIGLVTSALMQFLVTFVLLLNGAGLWAIVIGMFTRTGIHFLAGVGFVIRARRLGIMGPIRVSRSVLVEFARLSPATTLSGLGYVLTTQTEAALVGNVLGPERVPMLVLTRRAIDLAAGLLNALGFSSYAGFTHLVESPERERSRRVATEIRALWVSMAIATCVGYIAVNRSLVAVWADDIHYGGLLLTVLMALQMVATGHAQLSYMLYRATGAIGPGSLLQFSESVIRFICMVAFLAYFGLYGFALATLLTATPGSIIALRRTKHSLPPDAKERPAAAAVWLMRGALLALAVLLGAFVYQPNWTFVVLAGGSLTVASALSLLAVDRRLEIARDMLRRWNPRARSAALPAD
jgi:O-antigen/teichoic acid export membrane protein